MEAIQSSGFIRAGTYVTGPGELIGVGGQGEIESLLEIGSGKAAYSATFETPTSNLAVPEGGPLTSGGALQFQLIEPVEPGPFIPTGLP